MQALGPLLGAVVAAYMALMHCQRPHRFNLPADDAPDGEAPPQLPLPALAKRAFRFARDQLDHLARVFGFHSAEVLRVAVAPDLLAAAAPAEAAQADHGMHADDGPVATEAKSIRKSIDAGVRCPCSLCPLRSSNGTTWPTPLYQLLARLFPKVLGILLGGFLPWVLQRMLFLEILSTWDMHRNEWASKDSVITIRQRIAMVQAVGRNASTRAACCAAGS